MVVADQTGQILTIHCLSITVSFYITKQRKIEKQIFPWNFIYQHKYIEVSVQAYQVPVWQLWHVAICWYKCL